MSAQRPPRTLLEQQIRGLPMTLEEFVDHAETQAREHDLDGTISLRHLQRLITGQRTTVRPATARLLEALLDRSIDDLLARPTESRDEDDSRLDRVLAAGHAIDAGVIDALWLQLTAIRTIDRQLGANVVCNEVDHKIVQVEDLTHAVALPEHRRALPRLLCELQTLAGWIALDQLDLVKAWRHHNRATTAAREAESVPHACHALAQQSMVLAEGGRLSLAAGCSEAVADRGRSTSSIMQSWLYATHGEILGLVGNRGDSGRAFDKAASKIKTDPNKYEPYVGLDENHLYRWQSQTYANLGDPDTVTASLRALEKHDSSFRRAEASLRISLAHGLAHADRDVAQDELEHAQTICRTVDSPRQKRRASAVATLLT